MNQAVQITNREIIDYAVIESSSSRSLADAVKTRLQLGWVPHGSAAPYLTTYGTDSFLQTMVKYKPLPKLETPNPETFSEVE